MKIKLYALTVLTVLNSFNTAISAEEKGSTTVTADTTDSGIIYRGGESDADALIVNGDIVYKADDIEVYNTQYTGTGTISGIVTRGTHPREIEVSNSKVTVSSDTATNLRGIESYAKTKLTNVEVNVSSTTNTGVGILLGASSTLENVTVTTAAKGANISLLSEGSGTIVTGSNVTLNHVSGGQGVRAVNNSTVNLTDSSITAVTTGVQMETGGTVNLVNTDINITGAAGNAVYAYREGVNNFTMTGGSIVAPKAKHLIGTYTYSGNTTLNATLVNVATLNGSMAAEKHPSFGYQSYLNLTLDNTRWNVAAGSAITSVTLENYAALGFSSTSGLNFTDLYSTSVSLAGGTVLYLDQESSAFDSETITLFTGVTDWENNGTLLMTTDGYALEYIDNMDGSFTLTGQKFAPIPEPASAALGILGLAAFMAARRKQPRQTS